MKQYLEQSEWTIEEHGFHVEYNRISESIFSIGNGQFGQRANFEEYYSGDSHQGSYVAGVYYPDKTKVGWWKNGYPEYFAKVLNSVNWIGLDIHIDGEQVDLAKGKVSDFKRVLNMKSGLLERSFVLELPSGKKIQVSAQRFCSIADTRIGALKYNLKALNFSGKLSVKAFLDSDVENEDSNYEEKFWLPVKEEAVGNEACVIAETKKTAFQVASAMQFFVEMNGELLDADHQIELKDKYASSSVEFELEENGEINVYKYAAVISSLNSAPEQLEETTQQALDQAVAEGYVDLLNAHVEAWGKRWELADIQIEGDVSAQQGIRFNIFHLTQTYTGEDERFNIGPKGFTGEKYGGSTYWDTEAYCLPFYMATAGAEVGRQLLVYRHNHLGKAIENAGKLGFNSGAALYPMVTMNGEECHNEWEITFEEIHRNGAIAYGIYDYINFSGDKAYLAEYGLEVLIGIARFWAQRVNWSVAKNKYVMLGVTGPNEYENNVNNNWYTNYMASWCLRYCKESMDYVKENNPDRFNEILKLTAFDISEWDKWQEISDKMYYPVSEEKKLILQQEGFMDKDLRPVTSLGEGDYPLCQNWSWDRILRSCFIKQADVLQGMYFFEDDFKVEDIERNFDFYEPMTVHESSLSPCVHSILAAKLNKEDKAYEMYLRTARLDLDDYNNDTEDGLHITSMAGTWMSVVKGFGGMRMKDSCLHLNPMLPANWKSFAFKLLYKGVLITIKVASDTCSVSNPSEQSLEFYANGSLVKLEAESDYSFKLKSFENA
jgi:maltose phosphorylase